MSLKDVTVLDETLKTLLKKSWEFMDTSLALYMHVNQNKRQPPTFLLKKIKKLAREINEICEELP